MSLYKEWTSLMESQTDETFDAFWKEYSEIETNIYSDILNNPQEKFTGTFKELTEKYKSNSAIFTGFLDGIQDSLKSGKLSMDEIVEDTIIDFDIDFEKLFFNMLAANAKYLYTLDQWNTVLGKEKLAEIAKEYKRSKTVVNEKKIGRNDPCPCGSGKKYKHCCGK